MDRTLQLRIKIIIFDSKKIKPNYVLFTKTQKSEKKNGSREILVKYYLNQDKVIYYY